MALEQLTPDEFPAANTVPEQVAQEQVSTIHTMDGTPEAAAAAATTESWAKRNRVALGIAGLAAAGALSVGLSHDFSQTVDDLEHNAAIALVFPVTETLAWGGAIAMVASAGSKIGNPMTVKKRLTGIRDQLNDNTLYRTGWAMGAAGAIGTSATVAIGAVAELPPSSWPIAASLSATSIALSTIPFKPAKAKGKHQK